MVRQREPTFRTIEEFDAICDVLLPDDDEREAQCDVAADLSRGTGVR